MLKRFEISFWLQYLTINSIVFDQPQLSRLGILLECGLNSGVQSEGGGERGGGSGHPRQGGIQLVKLQKLHFVML